MKTDIMNVSIGIIAYNEEKNIGKLIEKVLEQDESSLKVREIIIVSDGSTDRTNAIVEHFSLKDPRIRFFCFEKREGKYKGINVFLRESSSPILVLCSADIMFQKNTISLLCEPLANQNAIISLARPTPLNSDNLLGRCIQINWDLHHVMSKIQPKGTELMAFRKIKLQLPKTMVDEEHLLVLFLKEGRAVYTTTAPFFNKGPTRYREFISQIRRYYAGHKFLQKETGHIPITSQNILCLRHALLNIKKYRLAIFPFFFLQMIGRSLGYADFITNQKKVIWKCATTTKDLSKAFYDGISQPTQEN